ncbi:HutD family protein [Clostridiaceae bacterium HSG29]|nr:HutD family protein [Clostridiaceae bacterium HSG29]
MKLIKSKNLITKNWSGGKTRELYIFPENKLYENRDFDFRISSATVEVEESVFTSLPNYNRILMILEGELFIEHTNHHSINLKQFEIDEFSGEWETRSKGKVTDFNLMMTSNLKGNVKVITINGKYSETKKINEVFVFYCYEGRCLINGEVLNKFDVLIINENDESLIEIISEKEAKLIESRIIY